MLINESVKNKGFSKGKVYVENRLVPVCNKPDCCKLKKERLFCALVSPNGNKTVMLDKTGEEYIVDIEEFHSELSYTNRNSKEVCVPRFLSTHGTVEDFSEAIGTFCDNPTNGRRYKSWGFSDILPVMNSAHEGASLPESVANPDTTDDNDKIPAINECYTVKGRYYKCVGVESEKYYMQDSLNDVVVMPRSVFTKGAVL